MIYSMTGFGAAQHESSQWQITIEIKTLNSKQADINVRLPRLLNSQELDIRKQLTDQLERGKISVYIEAEHLSATPAVEVNKELFKKYYQELKEARRTAHIPESDRIDYVTLITNLPNVLVSKINKDDNELWQELQPVLSEAIDKVNLFRKQEGQALYEQLHDCISRISELLEKIKTYDPQRQQAIKGRLNKRIEELSDVTALDSNRLEQEMLFYIEKLDISEEKIRLANHLSFFEKTLNTGNGKSPKGKKLNFISQEIGREINTIGSKANDPKVQQMVVQMKEELEKIKEQSLNVL